MNDEILIAKIYLLWFYVGMIKYVWDCGSSGGSKCFSLRNASKWSFFYFLKIIFDIRTSKRSETIKKLF
jgi:hypothetical protein